MELSRDGRAEGPTDAGRVERSAPSIHHDRLRQSVEPVALVVGHHLHHRPHLSDRRAQFADVHACVISRSPILTQERQPLPPRHRLAQSQQFVQEGIGIDEVWEVICSGDPALYKYVIAWCADAVQNPAHRPGVVLVLKGPPGTGKGTFAHAVGSLFGHHFVYAARSSHVTGKFNSHVANKFLMFADEAVFAGDRPNEGALKSMITERDLAIELKGKDVIYTRNHLRIIMASNQEWVVPAAIGDRRFAIIEVSPLRMQNVKYFGAIHDQLRDGGDAAPLHHLLTFNLEGIELRQLPRTNARLQQQLLSMPPIEKWWYGRLQSGAPTGQRDEWMSELPVSEMFDDYAQESGVAGARHRGDITQFGITMFKLVPGLGKGRTKPTRGVRVNIYKIPSLADCREAFAKMLGGDVPWPEDEEGGADRAIQPM